MDELDKWRLSEDLNIIQAALLMAGEDPSSSQYFVEDRWKPESRPNGYEAAKTALSNAVISRTLEAKKIIEGTRVETWLDPDGLNGTRHAVGTNRLDLEKTIITVVDLRNWLAQRGMRTGFFFDGEGANAPYLDENNAQYAPKLAAAIRAWEAVTGDPELRKAKSVKEALTKWLRESATLFCLTKDDGTLNEKGIDEVAKVANWNTSGGAPKTPKQTKSVDENKADILSNSATSQHEPSDAQAK